MSTTFYQLRIATEDKNYQVLCDVFGNDKGISTEFGWCLEFTLSDDDPYLNYIEYFITLIESKLTGLKKIGISESEISIWIIAEYNGQFNTEFSPSILKKLSHLGLTLCLSAYEVDGE